MVSTTIALVSIPMLGISPALAGILGPREILQTGDSGPDVGALQRQLRELGLYSGTVTEVYGPLTEAAVSAYQRSVGLTADGIFGAQTDRALFDGILPQTTSIRTQAISTSSDRTLLLGERLLSSGNRGSDVRELQTLLRDNFAPSIVPDGIFGSNTESAVRDFQRQYGLDPDGTVGDQTLGTLRAVSSGQSASSITTQNINRFNVGQNNTNQATRNASVINKGPYIVVVPADDDDDEKLAWVRETQPRACMTRSRRGSYIFAGGFEQFSSAETMRLALRANRRENEARTDARVDYRGGDFAVDCLSL